MASPVQRMKSALDAIRSATQNAGAMTYAPWVLIGMLLVAHRDSFSTMLPADWARLAVIGAVLVVLGRLGQRALLRQRAKAEQRVLQLLRGPHGIRSFNQLQARSRAYRQIPLSNDLQRALIDAAMRAERDADERRVKAERERADQLAPV